MGHVLIMPFEQVAPEVVLEITPDRMHVVCAILDVVVFQQEGRALNTIIVRIPDFLTSHPGKLNVFDARPVDGFKFLIRELGTNVMKVEFQ